MLHHVEILRNVYSCLKSLLVGFEVVELMNMKLTILELRRFRKHRRVFGIFLGVLSAAVLDSANFSNCALPISQRRRQILID